MTDNKQQKGLEFYNIIYDDNDFCVELGRAVLAAGRLEAQLIIYLKKQAVTEEVKKASLGRLIVIAKEHELLSKMVPVLENLKDQRNYLTHNIYALFSGVIDETILSWSHALEPDAFSLTQKAWQLKENLNGLADTVANENKSSCAVIEEHR